MGSRYVAHVRVSWAPGLTSPCLERKGPGRLCCILSVTLTCTAALAPHSLLMPMLLVLLQQTYDGTVSTSGMQGTPGLPKRLERGSSFSEYHLPRRCQETISAFRSH